MDARSRKVSMCVYYGFGCCEDTCATVKIFRRTMWDICNHFFNLIKYNEYYMLGTGSQYEGTSLFTFSGVAKSDADQMRVDPQFQVYPFGYSGDYDLTKYCLKMRRSKNTRPGYCLVEVVGENFIDLDSYIKQTYLPHSQKSTCPAFRIDRTYPATKFGYDLVPCFASKQWPSECRNWPATITWPIISLQESIKAQGFLIVKVGHPLSPERDQEYRLSFSVAEKMLIHSFNPTQLTCAVVMKLFLYHYIQPVVPNSINSYHIKTLILWSVEQDKDQKWEPQYFIECLTNLLKNLLKCISVGKLQHYFVPHNDLFVCKVTEENKELLLQKVKSLQLTVLDKCMTFLRLNRIIFLKFHKYMPQLHCLQNIAFVDMCVSELSLSGLFLMFVCDSVTLVVRNWMEDSYISQHQCYRSLVDRIEIVMSSKIPKSNKVGYERLSDKWLSYVKTLCGSILISFYKSKIIKDMTFGNDSGEHSSKYICSSSAYLLQESYENASTTGSIKMALVHMCESNHYHAVPFLNRTLNIIDKLHHYSLYKKGDMPPPLNKYNFTEYMHMYNDKQAIENELLDMFLNDKVLFETPLIWLEMSVLPSLLQLELTHTFYKVDILFKLNEPCKTDPFQFWNPIPLTHFLLFICHYELLKSVTFLDPACLQDDIGNLQSLIHDRKRLGQSDVPLVLNFLTWCYLEMGDNKMMLKHAIKTVQHSTKCEKAPLPLPFAVPQRSKACDKTMFSHLFIHHVISAIIGKHKYSECIVFSLHCAA